MNKRLRKKKRVGEFKEFGFELLGDLRRGISDDDINAFVDRLIVVVEARKLGFGGGGGRDGKFEGLRHAHRARQRHRGRSHRARCIPRGRRRHRSSRGRRAARRLVRLGLTALRAALTPPPS